jgi:uncharacterized repeat protein (TIGR03843 family)
MNSEYLYNILSCGNIELKGQFTLGSNYTFLVTVKHAGQEFPAVYKPQKGEQPLWDFPENTLAGREVAAYHVSQALGWNLVPYTVFRDEGPYGPGSLQQYIEYDPAYHYFNFKAEDKEKLRTVALFDHLTNNADRKGSHVFFDKDTHELRAIDHGLCFNVDDKLRTVIWDFAGEPIPPEHISALRQIVSPPESLLTELRRYLMQEEIVALIRRAKILVARGTFPQPPPGRRAVPYPPL